jgi:glutamate-5-semialdehyde dehydrogenase
MLSSSLSLETIAQATQRAARELAARDGEARNQALGEIAVALETSTPEIMAANQRDCQAAQGLEVSLYNRLKLTSSKLNEAIAGIRNLARLPDPLGVVQIYRQLDEGLILKRVSCPLGVIGVIFEARPDALIQITSLAIKSGNGVILKGGAEALHTNQALMQVIHRVLATTTTGVNPQALQLLTSREEIQALLKLEQYVDLIIPRGSNELVRYIQNNTKIPVLGHASGICHLYIDASAAPEKAIPIAVDAKTQYPSACNTIETLLIHQAIAPTILPPLATALQAQGVELRGDSRSCAFFPMLPATEADWSTEYGDLILAVRVVDSLESAIAHIHTYGSKHTEAIITEDSRAAEIFGQQVDAAGVFHNCSTRFADGFRYGFGAEVGISTQKLPPRGPVGLEGLVTYKYQLVGQGHIVATYTGAEAKAFTHKDFCY